MTVPRIMGVIRSRIRGFAVTHQQAVDWEGHASGVNDVPGQGLTMSRDLTLVRPEGIEPPTYRVETGCSIR